MSGHSLTQFSISVKKEKDENRSRNVRFKFNGIYRLVSQQTIM